MTGWLPRIEDRAGPRYRAIADAIAEDVASGALPPGARLPTHRDLAWRLGVTVGTITRAYMDAERRGLIAGEVGRGTFVKDQTRRGAYPVHGEPVEAAPFIDLSINQPMSADLRLRFAETVGRICADPAADALLRYQPWRGLSAHREAGSLWLSRFGVDADPDRVQVTSGGQNAMAVSLMAVAKPGDLVLTEQLTYPAFKALANGLNLRSHGVAIDEDGLIPAAFEAACRQASPRVLYLMPTVHNPTRATLPEERREAIAAIARRHDVTILEDDVYGCLLERPPAPVAAFGPEQTIYFTSLSKSVAPGLRVGYLTAPPGILARTTDMARAVSGMALEFAGAVAREWILDGTADRLAADQRAESAARQDVAERILGPLAAGEPRTASFLWMHLPEPWRRDEFAAAAARRGVRITPADAFMVGRGATPHAVRISLCAPPTRDELERGLSVLADILADAPSATAEVV